jgi:hypothetical protein
MEKRVLLNTKAAKAEDAGDTPATTGRDPLLL